MPFETHTKRWATAATTPKYGAKLFVHARAAVHGDRVSRDRARQRVRRASAATDCVVCIDCCSVFTRDGVTLPGTIFLIFCFDVLFFSASLFLVSLTAFRLWLHHASCRLTVCPLSICAREGSSVKSCSQLRVLRSRSQWFLATSALQHGVSSKIMSPLELLAKRATPRERRR